MEPWWGPGQKLKELHSPGTSLPGHPVTMLTQTPPEPAPCTQGFGDPSPTAPTCAAMPYTAAVSTEKGCSVAGMQEIWQGDSGHPQATDW